MRASLLLSLLLVSSALAGGAGGPRLPVPDFAAASRWSVDCDTPGPRLRGEDGCRLRLPLPPGTRLPAPGEMSVQPGPDRLTVLHHAPPGTREVSLCCGLQLPLAPLPGTRLWAVTARVRHVERAALSLSVVVGGQPGSAPPPLTWRGPQAPAARPEAPHLLGRVDRFSLSSGEALIGARRITVYTPPGWTPAESLPAVYLADGDSAEALARSLEPAMRAGEAPRAVLVGIESGPSLAPGSTTYRHEDDRRSLEYLEGFPGGTAAFAAHERFVLNTVLPHVEREYQLKPDPQARAVGGFSNGGAWAISMAARSPGVFRGVIALSPSNVGAQAAPHPAARVFTQGGTLEPSFLSAARRYAALTRQAGNPTRLVQRVGGHDFLMWAEAFPEAVAFALHP